VGHKEGLGLLLLQAIGGSLPAAMAVAISPFPVIGIVLLLAGSHGRRNGVLFAAGWVVGLAFVVVVVALVFGGADDPGSGSSTVADWLQVLAGAGLIVLGVRKWRTRPRGGAEVAVPGWMASLDDVSGGRALMLGALLSGANPKNVVLTAAAATTMVEAGVEGAQLAVSGIVFVFLGSVVVIGAVVGHLAGGPRAASMLDTVRQFMVTNSAVIMVIVLLVLGANILGGGLSGLGR
jgi:threonine/homoserine/homoserine lactone efflux protein